MAIVNSVGTDMDTVVKLKADAKQRSWRTVLQGLGATIVVGVLPLVNSAIANGIDKVNWVALEQSAATAAVMAIISYLMAFMRPVIVDTAGEPAAKVVDEKIAEVEKAIPDAVLTLNEAIGLGDFANPNAEWPVDELPQL